MIGGVHRRRREHRVRDRLDHQGADGDVARAGDRAGGDEPGGTAPFATGRAFGGPPGSVSVSDLCTHTSRRPSLPRTPVTLLRLLAAGWLATDPYRGTNPARVIASACRQRLVRRGRYRYSNLAAAVLGHGLARAAGCDYPTLLHRRVLLPLGMGASAPALATGRRGLDGGGAAGVAVAVRRVRTSWSRGRVHRRTAVVDGGQRARDRLVAPAQHGLTGDATWMSPL